jgi:glycosyltransferase involved in cell wall biosynthesis
VRILLINDYREAGGCERIMQRTAVGLRRRGHSVEVFTGEDVPGRRTPWSYVENRRARRALRARLDSYAPDIVHFFNVYHELSPGVIEEADRWRAGRRARVLMTCADAHLVCPNAALQRFDEGSAQVFDSGSLATGWRLWRTRWDERSRAHSLLKSLQHTWNYRLRRRWRCIDAAICASKFLESTLVPCGVPTVRIPDPLPERVPTHAVSAADGPVRLVFCGRVEPEKGLCEFIEAAAGVEGWTLEVVGDGRDKGRVQEVARREGVADRVTLCGWVEADEAVKHIAQADILVLPSRCCENAPACMFEALACGTGLLVGDLGGMPEIVADSGVGLVFDPFDAADMRATLARTIEAHRAGRVAAGDAGGDVSGYLASRGVEKYLDLLEMLYDGGHGGMPCAC